MFTVFKLESLSFRYNTSEESPGNYGRYDGYRPLCYFIVFSRGHTLNLIFQFPSSGTTS